jgi:hypothetical protein
MRTASEVFMPEGSRYHAERGRAEGPPSKRLMGPVAACCMQWRGPGWHGCSNA